MEQKVLTTLEYNKIIQMLTQKADSEPGKELCRNLIPSTDLSKIRSDQAQTAAALGRQYFLRQQPRLGIFREIP